MKTHNKKAFGLFGLLLVAVTTVYAATITVPGAIAATPTTVTDTLVVRVIGATPHVEFTGATSGETFFAPVQTFPFIYDNTKTVTITLEHTDTDGNTHEYVLETIDADYTVGSGVVNLDLSAPNYGYGDYVIRITGDHQSAISDEDSIAFSYYPFTATVQEDDESDNAILTLDYDEDDTDIEKFEVEVRDENGQIVPGMPTITLTPPEKTTNIPFADNKLPAGTYTIVVTSYDADGVLYVKRLTYVYEPTLVPNTGSLLAGLNISRTDYLVTGLFVFFVAGVSGLAFVARKNKSSKKRR